MNFIFSHSKKIIKHNNTVYTFYRTNNIFKLKRVWNQMVDPQNGEVYLTYQYNSFCAKLFSLQNFLHTILGKSNKQLVFIYGISEDNKTIIFPGVVDKRKKKIFFLGEQYSSGAGYNDVIGNYDINMWEAFIKYLNLQYGKLNGGYTLSLHDIIEKSVIPQKEKERPCVRIQIRRQEITDTFYDLWYSTMSKSSRQNLRTAYNRMKTDNVAFEMKTYDKLSLSDKLKCFRLISKRSKQLNGINEKKERNRIIRYIKDMYKLYFSISFYMFNHSQRSQLTVLKLNHCVSACMITHNEYLRIVVPKLAIDTEYSRYSPGCVMISEYIKKIKSNESEFVLDLSRGAEKYKLSLGGELYYNYGCDIVLK